MKTGSGISVRVSAQASGETMSMGSLRTKWAPRGVVAALAVLALTPSAGPPRHRSAWARSRPLTRLPRPAGRWSCRRCIRVTASTPASPDYNDGQVIVRFKPGASPSTRRNVHRALDDAGEEEPPASEYVSRQVQPAPRSAPGRRGLRAPRGASSTRSRTSSALTTAPSRTTPRSASYGATTTRAKP